MYGHVRHAVDRESQSTTSLSGVHAIVIKNVFHLEATERHMGSESFATVKAENCEAIIPPQAFDAILDATEGDAEIEISIGNTFAMFVCEEVSVVTNIIEGGFLDFGTLPRDGFDTTVKAATSDLASLIKRLLCTGIDETSHGMVFEISKKGINAKYRNNTRELTASLPCKVEGPDVTIGLSAKYLPATIAAHDGEEIEINFNGPTRPIAIKNGHGEWSWAMPVNLQ
jgi:DNA polymerase III sliding clamp (beta) subunit (PCNA family)